MSEAVRAPSLSLAADRTTGHRIKYLKVDADTGEEVANEDVVKGYALDKDTFIEVSKEELDEIALGNGCRAGGFDFAYALARWRTAARGVK
jgi:non-homologous end joining protein Ku